MQEGFEPRGEAGRLAPGPFLARLGNSVPDLPTVTADEALVIGAARSAAVKPPRAPRPQ